VSAFLGSKVWYKLTSFNVSLSKVLKGHVERHMAKNGSSTPSEYVRAQIREDRSDGPKINSKLRDHQ